MHVCALYAADEAAADACHLAAGPASPANSTAATATAAPAASAPALPQVARSCRSHAMLTMPRPCPHQPSPASAISCSRCCSACMACCASAVNSRVMLMLLAASQGEVPGLDGVTDSPPAHVPPPEDAGPAQPHLLSAWQHDPAADAELPGADTCTDPPASPAGAADPGAGLHSPSLTQQLAGPRSQLATPCLQAPDSGAPWPAACSPVQQQGGCLLEQAEPWRCRVSLHQELGQGATAWHCPQAYFGLQTVRLQDNSQTHSHTDCLKY